MAKHAVLRTDNMDGTILGEDLVSGKYLPGDTATAIDNGNVVVIGDLIDGEREMRKLTTPAANTNLWDCGVVGSEEVLKDKSYNTLDEFYNEAGAPCRVYRFKPYKIFSVTKEAFASGASAQLKVGGVVELMAGTTFNCVASATASTTQVGKIIAVEGDFYVIQLAGVSQPTAAAGGVGG